MKFIFADYFIIAVIVIVLAVDAVLAKRDVATTISFRTAEWSRKYPMIPFLLGVLCGHLWYYNSGYCPH